MSSDIGSLTDDPATDPLNGWSSPFTISQYEHDNLRTAITETSEISTTEYNDRNKKYPAVARSVRTMDIVKASNLLINHNLGIIEGMLGSFRKQPNHAALPDVNTEMTTQPSISSSKKSKTQLPTNQSISSTTPRNEILERNYDLSAWSNAEENHHNIEVKQPIQIEQEIVSKSGPCDIPFKAHGCIDLALQASTPITFILTGITTSREIRIRKLYVNGQKYVFVHMAPIDTFLSSLIDEKVKKMCKKEVVEKIARNIGEAGS
ncbi:hypothetical protein ACH3XW_20220 [Acanthocheilonema viteae]